MNENFIVKNHSNFYRYFNALNDNCINKTNDILYIHYTHFSHRKKPEMEWKIKKGPQPKKRTSRAQMTLITPKVADKDTPQPSIPGLSCIINTETQIEFKKRKQTSETRQNRKGKSPFRYRRSFVFAKIESHPKKLDIVHR